MNFDESDELFKELGADKENPSSAPDRKRRGGAWLVVFSVALLASGIAVAGVFGYSAIKDFVDGRTVEDYSGSPGELATIVVEPGETGEDVARKLVAADIIKSFDAIYRPMLASNFIIYPGTYSLPTQLSGAAALELLRSGEARVVNKFTLQEGLRATQIFAIIHEVTQLPLADLLSASEDLAGLGVENQAESIEGYIFPATYEFDPGVSAEFVMSTLVNRTVQELNELGVPTDLWHETLTMASLIQGEGKTRDFEKVSRVFANRLDIGMPLQSDATVVYATNGTKVTTTDEQRATDSPYNTYFYAGMPIGPINSPSSLAIQAALSPGEGEWLYFVSINLETGETVFTDTYAEHLVEVEKFRTWIRANPGWNE